MQLFIFFSFFKFFLSPCSFLKYFLSVYFLQSEQCKCNNNKHASGVCIYLINQLYYFLSGIKDNKLVINNDKQKLLSAIQQKNPYPSIIRMKSQTQITFWLFGPSVFATLQKHIIFENIIPK